MHAGLRTHATEQIFVIELEVDSIAIWGLALGVSNLYEEPS